MRDHVLSDDIIPVCDRMRYSYRLESGAFLRAVLEKNPNREMQGVACLFLARFLNDRLRMVQLAKDRPDLARRFEIAFGQDTSLITKAGFAINGREILMVSLSTLS